jgi:hypothetical protein
MLKLHLTTSGGMDTAEYDLIRSVVFDNCIIVDGGVIKQPNGDASTTEKGETQCSENMLLALDVLLTNFMILTSILAQNMTEATMMSTYHHTKDIGIPHFKKITSRAPAPSRVSVGKWQVRTFAPALDTKTDDILGGARIKSAYVEWKEVRYQPLPPAEPPHIGRFLTGRVNTNLCSIRESRHII